MRHNIWRWLGLLVVLSMLFALVPAALAGPAEQEGKVAKSVRDLPMFRVAKWREHLRVPRDEWVVDMLKEAGVLPMKPTLDQVEAALREFRAEWARHQPTTPNPEKFRQLLRNERLAAEAGMSPKAMGLAVEQDIKILVALVEFPGTDTFTYSAEDPDTGECVDVEVTTTGPLHNEIPAPGPRDNNTFWTDDFTPELYEELYFGIGPEAGIIANHPNLGPVDLRGLTVANYYLEQSEGAYAPEGLVYPKWLQAAHSEGWYGADSCETGSHGVRVRDLVREVVDLINADDPNFPWQEYDGDGDGTVDNFTIIHAGMGQEAGGGLQGDFSIWSHASSVDWPTGYLACAAGSPGCPDRDIYVLHYSMDPENFDVGVGAEEFGHAAFGLPDIYTVDYSNSVANWSIMSAGSWNGPLGGMQPAPFPGWFRYVIGWWDPVEVNYDDPATEVVVGQHSLRPEGTEQGMKINLPDATRYMADPYSGEYMWWGNEGDLMDNAVRRSVDLTGKTTASLGFWTYYEIEEGWDFGFVQVSTDGGATWTSLENPDTTYDHDPSAIDTVVANLPGFTGHSDGWVYEEFDLTPYAGQEFLLQFRYVTDWAYTERGWFIDDITITADGEPIFFDDVEAGPGDWTADPEDGWIITTGTITGIQYYLVEWRNYSGFDEGLQYPYQSVWFDEDEWEVDRVPYSVPGMLLWYRNTMYTFDYVLGDSWFDPPSWGPKHALLVVDSHPFPYMWDGIQYYTGQNVRLGGRQQSCDAAFTLQDTTPFTIRRGFDETGQYVPEIQETKTFGPRPAVRNFHDYLGYYPGLWCCWVDPAGQAYLVWWDIDASAVIPAEGDYTTKVTWADNTPAYDLYGLWGILGSGNPGDDDVQFGVNLCVQDQAEDGSWGDILFASFKLDGTGFVADPTEVLPGEEVEFVVAPNNLGGGSPVFVFVPLRGIPADLVEGSLTNGAFPIFGTWTSAQVAALYQEGGAEAVQALSADWSLPIAGIGWIGTVPKGLNEAFRFRLVPRSEAQGTSFSLWADFYLCGDLATSLASDEVMVLIPAPATESFLADVDTYVNAWAPNASYGDRPTFSVRQPTVMDALLHFDVSSIPPLATVDEAKLKLFVTNRSNVNKLYLAAYSVLEPWDEAVTWNTAPAAGDTAVATAVVNATGELELNVTTLVQAWVSDPTSNFGLMLRGEGTRPVEYSFTASEFITGLYPVLEVSYH